MTDIIIGLDVSKWQGELTQTQMDKFKEKGVKFVYVRFSQGGGYKDPYAKASTALLQSNGFFVGPYHFVTLDNPLYQYDNFVAAMGDIQFDLPPALDCEAYQAQYSTYGYMMEAEEVLPIRDIHYTLSYPTEAIVDVMGRKLRDDWMMAQSKLSQFPEPAIYTNVSSGNTIFKSPKMSRYLLWIANWGVAKPYLPNIWKDQKYFIWQDGVVDGAPYGIMVNKVDHDLWGVYMDFPTGDTPEPPDPPDPPDPEPTENWIQLELTFPDGSEWAGKVTKVEA